jgi:hypothetical protein
MDPFQPPGEKPGTCSNCSHNGFSHLLVQGCRIEAFSFTGTQKAGSTIGDYSVAKATSGFFNIEWGLCKEAVFRENYVRSNCAQFFYALNNPVQGGEPGPIAIFDNIFEPQPGSAAVFGDKFANANNTHIEWGRNINAQTGAEIEFYYQIVNGQKQKNGILVPAKASNQYRSYFTGSPPPPPPPPPSTDPPLRAISTATSGATTSSTLRFAKPDGLTPGDVMVWAVTLNDTTGTFPADLSWDLLPGAPASVTVGAATRKMYVATRTAGSAEPDEYVFTLAASKECSGALAAYMGMDGADPVDVASLVAAVGSGTTASSNVTTTVANTHLVTVLGADVTNATAPDAWSLDSAPAKKRTEVYDTATYMTTSVFDEPIAGTGLASRTGTLESTSVARMIALIALRPATAPPAAAKLQITTPAADSTHTSGSVVFIGGADTSVGDSDSNYFTFGYYFEDVLLASGSAGNDPGFTFHPTSAGVDFTDKAGTARSYTPGTYTLKIRGYRKDTSIPEKSIEVTFGTVVAPPPPSNNIGFSATVTLLNFPSVPDVDTRTGGVAEPIERVSRKVPRQYVIEWYWRGTQTLREVEFVNGEPVYKGQS